MNNRLLLIGLTLALLTSDLANRNLVIGQMTAKEIYQLDVVYAEQHGNSEKKVAAYFIGLGRIERDNLILLEQKLGGLDAPTTIRKQLLEELLAPFEKALADFDDLELIDSLRYDVENSNKVFAVVGEERAIELVTEKILKNFSKISSRSEDNSYSPISCLNHKAVARLMSFTDEQKKDIEKLIANASKQLRFGSEMDFDKLVQLLADHWVNLLATLDDQQRPVAKELIGEPVQWFRNAGKPLSSGDFLKSGMVSSSGHIRSLKSKDGRSIIQMNPDEIERLGVEFVHAHVERMLRNPFVWDELELSSDQRKQLKNAKNADVFTRSGYHEFRLAELISGKVSFPSAIDGLFNKDQLIWFRQMELQILTGKFESSIGLLHPSMVAHLKISADQNRQVQRLADKYEEKAKELFQLIKEDRDRIQEDFSEDVVKLMTDRQKSIYRQLTGDVLGR